jgi:3-oxoacyl-[acyl-carrier protein] reductase
MNTKKLAGKVAVVTGASKGIGAAIAKHLAAEGASVVVNYSSSKEGAERVVQEVTNHGGKAIAVKANLSQKTDIDRLFHRSEEGLGQVDILVNNAGVYEFSPVEEITEDHFRKHFDLNVLGLTLATQAAVKQFNSTGGSIVNISSLVSTLGFRVRLSTAVPRARWMPSRARSRRNWTAAHRVNSVNPGMIETDGLHSSGVAKAICANRSSRRRRWAASANPMTLRRPRSSLPRMIRHGSPAKP